MEFIKACISSDENNVVKGFKEKSVEEKKSTNKVVVGEQKYRNSRNGPKGKRAYSEYESKKHIQKQNYQENEENSVSSAPVYLVGQPMCILKNSDKHEDDDKEKAIYEEEELLQELKRELSSPTGETLHSDDFKIPFMVYKVKGTCEVIYEKQEKSSPPSKTNTLASSTTLGVKLEESEIMFTKKIQQQQQIPSEVLINTGTTYNKISESEAERYRKINIIDENNN